MKIAVYLVLFLLGDPISRIAGSAVAAWYLLALIALGVALLVRSSERKQNAPQYRPPAAPYPYGWSQYSAPPVYRAAPPPPPQWPVPTQIPMHYQWGPPAPHQLQPHPQPQPQPQRQPPVAVPTQRRADCDEVPHLVPPGGAPLWLRQGDQ